MQSFSIKESLHKDHVKRMGKFHIDCNTAIFTKDEIEILEKWGHWFVALCSGYLSPFTEKQRRFIEAMKGERAPFSVEEVAFHKYLGRKKVEKKYGDKLHYNYVPEENGFFTREMWEQQKKLMWKINIRNHHE